jgi:hypothetical protein
VRTPLTRNRSSLRPCETLRNYHRCLFGHRP